MGGKGSEGERAVQGKAGSTQVRGLPLHATGLLGRADGLHPCQRQVSD